MKIAMLFSVFICLALSNAKEGQNGFDNTDDWFDKLEEIGYKTLLVFLKGTIMYVQQNAPCTENLPYTKCNH